jgi:signal transduction histidine kinase
MLQKSIEEEKNLKRISRIENACKMLQQRYNELDYLIKMQTKQVIKEQFFLDELIEERVEFLQKLYPHIVFGLQLSKYELFMDKIGLAKVIDNLIDNGVKYSGSSKKIDIIIQENMLLIKDYGIGMDEVQLLGIFDNYYQVNRDMQGFGIGLNMVKRFCDENSIELIFDSSPDVGTTVKLKFKKIQE